MATLLSGNLHNGQDGDGGLSRLASGVPLLSQEPTGLDVEAATPSKGHLRQYHDVWAAILFTIQFAFIQLFGIGAIVTFAIYGVKGFNPGSTVATSTITTIFIDLLSPLGPPLLLGVVLSYIWLLLLDRYPKAMVHILLWLGATLALIVGGVCLYNGGASFPTGVIFTIAGFAQVAYARKVQPLIPSAAVFMGRSVAALRKFPAIIWISYAGLFLFYEWLIVWAVTVGTLVFFMLQLGYWWMSVVQFLLFVCFFWTSLVINTTVHVTTCGTIGTCYFQGQDTPSDLSIQSFGRAVTYSFGSICFGTLVMPPILLVRGIVGIFRRKCRGPAIASGAGFSISWLPNNINLLLRYVNRLAFVQVAIYGKSFVQAAKDTSELFESHGFPAGNNRESSVSVLPVCSFISGLFSALLGGIYAYQTMPPQYHDEDGDHMAQWKQVVWWSFVIGFTTTSAIMTIVGAAAATYFVLFAEAQEFLLRSDPEFYEALQERFESLKQASPCSQ